MFQTFLTLVPILKVSICEGFSCHQSYIATELLTLLSPPIYVGSCLHIYGSSNENVVFVFNFRHCFMAEDILEKYAHHLAVN